MGTEATRLHTNAYWGRFPLKFPYRQPQLTFNIHLHVAPRTWTRFNYSTTYL